MTERGGRSRLVGAVAVLALLLLLVSLAQRLTGA